MLEKSNAFNKGLVDEIKTKGLTSVEAFGHKVVQVTHEDSSKSYYLINLNQNKLGEGGFGTVYKAEKIDPETGGLIEGAPPLAVKISKEKYTKDRLEEIQQEARIQARYFRDTFAVDDKNNLLIFTELLTANQLYKSQQAGQLKSLSMNQRIDLIEQIMLSLNIMHHATPTTGSSIVHKDIKPENIMYSIDVNARGERVVNAYVIDVGVAHELEEDDPSKSVDTDYAGTAMYIAPEVLLEGKGGPKSDMYSLVPVMAEILGADNAVSSKLEFMDGEGPFRDWSDSEYESFIELDFDYEGMWDWVEPDSPAYYSFIQESFEEFFKLSSAVDYDPRASSDDGLRFTAEIKKFARLNQLLEEGGLSSDEAASIKEDIAICKAKIEILTHGRWNDKIGKREIEKFTGEQLGAAEKPKATSSAEVDRTIGDIIQANPEIAPQISAWLKANQWAKTSEIIPSLQIQEGFAIAGMVGSALLLVGGPIAGAVLMGAVGAALVSNPVGWAIIGLTAAVGLVGLVVSGITALTREERIHNVPEELKEDVPLDERLGIDPNAPKESSAHRNTADFSSTKRFGVKVQDTPDLTDQTKPESPPVSPRSSIT